MTLMAINRFWVVAVVCKYNIQAMHYKIATKYLYKT